MSGLHIFHRRPVGCRPSPDGSGAAAATRYGVRSFTYREQAAMAADALHGWATGIVYVGGWDRWVVSAWRKSCPDGNPKMLLLDGTVG
jgi:hypothetical protein